MLGVQLHADRVGHGAGGNQQRRLLTENLGGAALQAVHGRVFAIYVVADFGFRHGAAHLRCRSGYSVTTQVDDHRFMNS